MNQFLNKDGNLVSFDTVDALIAFMASDENPNLDIKKGLANIANLTLLDEQSLLKSGDKQIILDLISRLFSAGGTDTLGNVIIDDNDLEIYEALFGSDFNILNNDLDDAKLNHGMTEFGYTFNYLTPESELGVYEVVDVDGNVIGIKSTPVFNESGDKIPIMVINPITLEQYLASDTSVTSLDYTGAYIVDYANTNGLMNLDTWLASDTSVTSADYDIVIDTYATTNVLMSEDDFKTSTVSALDSTDELYHTYLTDFATTNSLQTENEFLIASSTNLEANYTVEYLEPLAAANGLQDEATWTADVDKVDASYVAYIVAAAIPGFLYLDEWVLSGATETTETYYAYIVTNGGLEKTQWIISISLSTRADYIAYVVSNGAITEFNYFIDNSNLLEVDYPAYVVLNGAITEIAYFAANSNLDSSTYETVVQDSLDGVLLYEMEDLDYTISNPLSLNHITNIITLSTLEDKAVVKKELIVGILDNQFSPEAFVTPFLVSEDVQLLMKAYVHPNTSTVARFESLKTDTIAQDIKVAFVDAVVNKAQFVEASTVLSFYMKADETVGTVEEKANKAVLKEKSYRTLLTIATKDFILTSGIPEVDKLADAVIDSLLANLAITI